MTIEFNVLRNLDGSQGTNYMEILPGEFKYNWWNPESIFFHEDAFDVVETIICARVPSYDHYGTHNTPASGCASSAQHYGRTSAFSVRTSRRTA